MADTERAAALALADLVPRMARMIASSLQREADVALTLRQYRILARLTKRPHRTTELASTSNVSQPTATSVIAALESRNLVRRRPDPEDGRATLIELTPHGTTVFNKAHELVVDLLEQVTVHLEADVVRGIEKLAHDLSEGLDRVKEQRAVQTIDQIT